MKATIAAYFVNLGCTCLLLVCLVYFTGCKKFVDIQPPPDILTTPQVFTTDAKATAVVTSIYGYWINGANNFANFQTTLFGGYVADELLRYNASAVFQEFTTNSLLPGNSQVKNLWSTAYKSVYYANAALEGLEASASLTPAVKARLVAECYLIRAFAYTYLVGFWGDVPLVTTSDYRINALLPRTPVAEIYTRLIADLEAAKGALPLPAGADRTRPSRWAAAALLARLYLYTGAWQKAETEATAIISSGAYTPLPASGSAFLASSREAIFQLAPTNGPLKEVQNIRPSGTTPVVYLAPALLASFPAGDARRTAWIDSVTFQSVRYYFPAKYRSTGNAPTEYYTLLRVAEQYLIRAEARLRQEKYPEAITDMNVIRMRAGLAALPLTLSGPEVKTALERERRIELFAEWGHRWFDLKRWGTATAVLSAVKPSFEPTDELFPVPDDEILVNPFLTQNPGY